MNKRTERTRTTRLARHFPILVVATALREISVRFSSLTRCQYALPLLHSRLIGQQDNQTFISGRDGVSMYIERNP